MKVRVDQNTGKVLIRLAQEQLTDLEIWIAIYTLVDVDKDKMVVFFHGGDSTNKVVFNHWILKDMSSAGH